MNMSKKIFCVFLSVWIISFFLYATSLWADGNASTAGTIWDHVPEGGSIRAEGDGSWTILDRDMKPIGNVPPGQTAPTSPTPPQDSGTSGWSPDNLKGTVWDHGPEGGAIRANADGTWTILDRNMNPVGPYPPPAGSGVTPPPTD